MTTKVKAIIPKKLANVFKAALKTVMMDVSDDMLKDFEKTTQTWEHDVLFEQEDKLNSVPMSVTVFTEDEVYAYVNNGTRAHPIVPIRAPALVFQGGTYTAKTMPGVIGARSGGPSGPTVFRQSVFHPGTEARDFDKTLAEKWQSKFNKMIYDALTDAARDSGHGVT